MTQDITALVKRLERIPDNSALETERLALAAITALLADIERLETRISGINELRANLHRDFVREIERAERLERERDEARAMVECERFLRAQGLAALSAAKDRAEDAEKDAAELREEVMRQWLDNHWENCGKNVPPWPHEGICCCPIPDIISGMDVRAAYKGEGNG